MNRRDCIQSQNPLMLFLVRSDHVPLRNRTPRTFMQVTNSTNHLIHYPEKDRPVELNSRVEDVYCDSTNTFGNPKYQRGNEI